VGSGKFIFIKLPPHFALYILALSNVGPGHSTEEFTLTAPKSVRLVLAGKFMLLYFRRGWATVLPTSSWFFLFFSPLGNFILGRKSAISKFALH